MADENYDAIVIGTSQGGRFLPVELAKAGQRVALVERGPLGGVCVNTGCTPTKTMVASARLAYQARRGTEYGVRTGPVSVDLAAVRERKRSMVGGARENYASRLAQQGLDLIQGEAHFTGPKTVEVVLTDGGTRQISAPVVFMDPQLGRAGLTEREARAQGRAVRVAKLPMGAVIRAIETGETRGFMKAVVDSDSAQILGCAVLGAEGGEIMSIIQVAMLGKLHYTAMANAIFAHPLLAEGLNTLFAMFDA